MNMQWITWENC